MLYEWSVFEIIVSLSYHDILSCDNFIVMQIHYHGIISLILLFWIVIVLFFN